MVLGCGIPIRVLNLGSTIMARTYNKRNQLNIIVGVSHYQIEQANNVIINIPMQMKEGAMLEQQSNCEIGML